MAIFAMVWLQCGLGWLQLACYGSNLDGLVAIDFVCIWNSLAAIEMVDWPACHWPGFGFTSCGLGLVSWNGLAAHGLDCNSNCNG